MYFGGQSTDPKISTRLTNNNFTSLGRYLKYTHIYMYIKMRSGHHEVESRIGTINLHSLLPNHKI